MSINPRSLHRVRDLRPGDTFRLEPHSTDYTVGLTQMHPQMAGVVSIVLEGFPEPLSWPLGAPVILTHAPRTATPVCLLCKEPFPVECDLAREQLPTRGICGPCNARTSIAVIVENH